MSMKSKARTLGRHIRKTTGCEFTLAMKVAKKLVRDKQWDLSDSVRSVLVSKPFPCGYDCCGSEGDFIVGKKGEFRVR